MSGLDVAAGAAGLFSLSITLFQGCVKGFVLLSTAHNFGSGADLARCKIEMEQYRLFEWAESVNLEESPSRHLNWKLIEEILKQLLVLMTDTQKLRKEYGLILESTEDFLAVDDINTPKSGLRGRLTWLNPKFVTETARRLHNSSTPWKRLKWAACDNEGLRILIGDIVYLNNSLEKLLDRAERVASHVAFGEMLRSLVVQSSNSAELSQIQSLLSPVKYRQPEYVDSAVVAAAALKQSRLILGFDEIVNLAQATSNDLAASSTSSSMALRQHQSSPARASALRRGRSSAVRLELGSLSEFASTKPDTRREVARYEGKPVLVEWKSVDQALDSKLKHRIGALASLLSTTSHPSFHALHCRGFLKDTKTRRYAYVFDPPKLASTQPEDTAFEVRSLLDLLSLDGTKPSLDERICLALALAETVQQLHTSGWLHKGIRSENVIFLERAKHDWRLSSLFPVFLAGYEYARADSPLDITETPAARLESDIYRHPSLVGATPSTYQKQYDLYSLACVLLEIGLWSTLQRTLLDHLDSNKVKIETQNLNKIKNDLLTRRGNGSIHQDLQFYAGSKFASVVDICLHGGEASDKLNECFNNIEGSEEDEDVQDSTLKILYRVIGILKSCKY